MNHKTQDTELKQHLDMTRREAMVRALFGPGMIGLYAFATGIPAAVLMNPRRALAATGMPTATCVDPAKAQYLILSTSQAGDPVNANVPGTYEDAGIKHPTAATMAPTQMTLAGKQVTAAAPWASLPQATLDRTVFFHHGTYTVVHGDKKIMSLGDGGITNNEMLISMISSQLAGCLGTVQVAPVGMGGGGAESLSFKGRVQPTMSPSALASVLVLPAGPLANLQKMRDSTLDKLYAFYKAKGTPGQASFIDRYAKSQEELRTVSGSLLTNLANIRDNSPASQITAATALFQMNLAPAVSIHIPFGGDSHGDAASGFGAETAQTVSALTTINNMFTQLTQLNMQDKVTFMTLNVFGRTLAGGRDHNGNHHVAVMIGKGLKGGVVGKAAPRGGDYGATAIDSATGASNDSGDITFLDTFGAMGKTISASVGISEDYVNANINNGKIVRSVLA